MQERRHASEGPIFPGVGIELEYMIVDARTGDVRPIADEVLRAEAREITSDVCFDDICWSNELVLHVIELKTNGPATVLEGLTTAFQQHVHRINGLLAPLNARLMPTGMHPWMDPHRESRLWPHDYSPVYEAFDRIFGCSGHGWSNLQSMHLNLPFTGDEAFGRLHAAIRLVLPILPALAASSPIMDGRVTGLADNRLEVYRTNCAKIPSLTGRVIPEPVFGTAEYRSRILERCYRDLAPYDPEEVLRDEFVNARGAIARFVRDTIEIRLIDVQECPAADLAVASVVVRLVEALVREQWSPREVQQAFDIPPLERILLNTIRDGRTAVVRDEPYLRALGFAGKACTAGELWTDLAGRLASALPGERQLRTALAHILDRGPLSERIGRAVGPSPSRDLLREIYGQLSGCLADGRLFDA